MLAEREDRHAAAGLRVGGLGIERQAAHLGVAAEKKGERGADRGVGKAGQRLGRRGEVPDAADVGERDQERRLPLGEAQRTHEVGLVRVAPGEERGGHGVERRLRRLHQQAGGPRRVFGHQRPEIGRVIGEAEQQRARGVLYLARERSCVRPLQQGRETALRRGGRRKTRRGGEALSQRVFQRAPRWRAPAAAAAPRRRAG